MSVLEDAPRQFGRAALLPLAAMFTFAGAAACTSALDPPSEASLAAERLPLTLQESFDPFPEVPAATLSFRTTSGRVIHYAERGPCTGIPVLFMNGAALGHTEGIDAIAPISSMIDELGIRVIQLERVGYGHTADDNDVSVTQHVDDAAALMTHLGYPRFSVLALSTGGRYADEMAARFPARIESLHAVSTLDSRRSNEYILCPVSTPDALGQWFLQFLDLYEKFIAFGVADERVATSIPGFGAWLNGTAPLALDPVSHLALGSSRDMYNLCSHPMAASKLTPLTAPVFVYYGGMDPMIERSSALSHVTLYPNATLRLYPEQGHLAFWRHLGQIFVDIWTKGSEMVVCHNGHTRFVTASALAAHVGHGDTLDICAWQGTAGE